jgi:hypothetical protein
MDCSTFDERALVRLHQLVHEWTQPHGKNFGHDLAKAKQQTNVPIVFDFFCCDVLPKKDCV